MTAAVDVDGLGFGYGEVPVLNGVSFSVQRGEVFGVIGPNSAGKTTLLKLLSKVLAPRAGTIRLEGTDLSRIPRPAVARTVAVVPQELALAFPFTVRDFVLMGRYPHAPHRFFEAPEDLVAAAEALARADVAHLADKLVSELAGGERQLVLVARALAQRPRLLLLDEPNAHLDLRHQVALARLVRRLNAEGLTAVVVSHDLGLAAELCDRLLLLAGGRVARLGHPDDVLEADLIEAVYGCRVSVETNPKTGRPRVQMEWVDGDLEERR